MPSLSDIRIIVDKGIPFWGNRLKISTDEYKAISDFLNDATSMISAIEISDTAMSLLEKKPDWNWVFAFVKQELMNIRKCMRYKPQKLLKKGATITQKAVCADISIHLSNLEIHYPQILAIALKETDLKDISNRLKENKTNEQSSSTTSADRDEFWASL